VLLGGLQGLLMLQPPSFLVKNVEEIQGDSAKPSEIPPSPIFARHTPTPSYHSLHRTPATPMNVY